MSHLHVDDRYCHGIMARRFTYEAQAEAPRGCVEHKRQLGTGHVIRESVTNKFPRMYYTVASWMRNTSELVELKSDSLRFCRCEWFKAATCS